MYIQFGILDRNFQSLDIKFSILTVWIFYSGVYLDQYNIITKNCTGEWSRDDIQNIRKHYYAMIAEADEMVGAVINAIPLSAKNNTGCAQQFYYNCFRT